MAMAEGTGPARKSGPSLVVQILVLLVLTGGALGMGWFSGQYLNSSRAPEPEQKARRILTPEPPAKPSGKDGAKEAKKDDAEAVTGIVPLDAITTNLAAPSTVWVRIELSLVFDGPPDQPMANDIHQDILAYLRTLKMPQLEGASGFQHLKEDLEERAAIRSKGKVKQILVRTLLFE